MDPVNASPFGQIRWTTFLTKSASLPCLSSSLDVDGKSFTIQGEKIEELEFLSDKAELDAGGTTTRKLYRPLVSCDNQDEFEMVIFSRNLAPAEQNGSQ
eukprot:3901714-Ditylum_brightwellii.AAC.1